MQRRRFLVGIFAGLLFALAIVLSASYVPAASTPLTNPALYSTGGAQSTTVVVKTMTSTEAVTLSPGPPSGTDGSAPGLTSSITSMAATTTAVSPTSVPNESTATQTETTATGASSSSAPYAISSSTEEITTKVVTTTISSTETLSPGGQGNTYGSDTGSQQASVNGPAASPSSVSKIIGAPVQSVVLLLPVLIAVFLGLVFYKASAVRE